MLLLIVMTLIVGCLAQLFTLRMRSEGITWKQVFTHQYTMFKYIIEHGGSTRKVFLLVVLGIAALGVLLSLLGILLTLIGVK